MERFLIREWAIILPGCDRTAALARGAILAARWLQEPQPISNHPVGLGFPHPAGRYLPWRGFCTAPGCWNCRDMERVLTRRLKLIVNGCGETAALARGLTLAERWLQEPQPISNRPVELGF